METQFSLIKESKNVAFDALKPDNSWCCDAFMLSSSLWGKLPAISGFGMKIGIDEETGS